MKNKEHLYQIRMLYGWYDRLQKELEFVGGRILHGERYTDGSTTCTVVFYSNIMENKLDDLLRARLSNFMGWMELTKLTRSKRKGG